MTDYMEITEAFNQARTAPDVTDRASGLEEADRIGGVAMVQARLQGLTQHSLSLPPALKEAA